MDDLVKRVPPAICLILIAGVRAALADAGDDQFAVAAGHYSVRRWELAVEEFKTFLDYHADHRHYATATFYLAEALVQLGRYEEARANFRQMRLTDPGHRFAPRALFRAGETSYFAGDAVQAIEDLRAFREEYPENELNAYALPYLAESLLKTGDVAAARELFALALEKFPDGPLADDCRFGLAKAAQASGDLPLAAQLYDQLAAARDGRWADDAQYEKAAALYETGDYAGAVMAFDQLAAQFADSPLIAQATLARGWAHYQLQDYPAADERFAALADHDELGAQARLWRGLTQRAMGRYLQAAETFISTAASRPQHESAPELIYYAGDALLRGGESRRAIEQFQRVTTEWPDSPRCDDSLLGELNAALRIDDHDGVERLFDRFESTYAESPLRGEARRAVAKSCLTRKLFTRTEQLLIPTLQLTATPQDRYLLALALRGQDRLDEALEQLAIVLAAAEDSLENDAKWTRASILFTQARDEEAIAALQEILQEQSSAEATLACRARLAVCYARAGRWDDARVTFAEFETAAPDDELLLPTLEQLAEAAYQAADYDWAADLFATLVAKATAADTAAQGLSGLAWCRYQADQLTEAAELFARLSAEHPNHPLSARAALTRGAILDRLSRPDAALASYQTVIQSHPSSQVYPQALLAAADLYARLTQPDAAVAAYRQLVEEHPAWENTDTAIYRWAWLLQDADQPEQAAALFGRLHEEFPDSPYWADATLRAARHALDTRQPEQADGLITLLMQSEPDDEMLGHALLLQSQVAMARGDWSAVETPLSRLVESLPDHPAKLSAEYWLAEAAYRREDYKEAGGRFSDVRRQAEGVEADWLVMVPLRQAQVLAHEKNWRDALEIAKQIESSHPDFSQQYEVDYLIGRCHAAIGEFQEARQSYAKVIRSPAADKTETQAMAQWMIGESFFHQKNYRSALREYLRVEILYAYPAWQAAALLQAGKCQEQLGEWKQAAALYSRLVEDYPDQRFANEAAGRLREAKRRMQVPVRS